MIRAVAIDDEPFALRVIEEMAAQIPSLQLIACFSNAIEAREYLSIHTVELIFLDIQMPDISGIDLLGTIDHPPVVIFTTAHSEYAVKSYELSAIDYLLKPFSLQRFIAACHKAANVLADKIDENNAITVRSSGGQQRIRLADILYLESRGNYLQVYLNDQTVMIRMTIDEALKLLPPVAFLKVHRSYVVSMKRITRVTRKSVWIEDQEIPLSERYQYHFFSRTIK